MISINIERAVTIDIRDSNAMAILLLAADMMHFRRWSGEVYPDDAGVVVVRQREIRLIRAAA